MKKIIVMISLIFLCLISSCNMNNTEKKCIVTFDTDGGTYIPSQTVTVGETASKPDNPIKEGYIFDGWYLKEVLESETEDNKTPWLFSYYSISKDITLKAKWIVDTSEQTFITKDEWEDAFSINNVTLFGSDKDSARLVDGTMYFIEDDECICLYNESGINTLNDFYIERCDVNVIECFDKILYNNECVYFEINNNSYHVKFEFYFTKDKQISKMILEIFEEDNFEYIQHTEIKFGEHGTTVKPEIDHRILDPHLEVIDGIQYIVTSCGCGEVCNKEVYEVDNNTLIVGTTNSEHSEILEFVKPLMKELGYELQIKVYSDFSLPNIALNSGEIDANYFQHIPFLNFYNNSNNTDLVSVELIHYFPMHLVGNGISNLNDISKLTKIYIPSESLYQTRALLLLAQEGLIELHKNINFEIGITLSDITNNNGLTIQTVENSLIPQMLKEENSLVAVIGTDAINNEINLNQSLAKEENDSYAALTYGNIIAVKRENENDERILALVKILKSEYVKNWITNNYGGAILPM